MKKTLLGLLLAAVLVSFMMMPSLQGLRDRSDDQITFSPDDSMKTLQVKIQKMREQIRREGGTYDVDINPAMQYPLEQLCGFKSDMSQNEAPSTMELPAQTMTLPTSYTGFITAVKNQGNCGSCWAFGTTAAVESAILQAGTNTDLSEQYVLDCNPWNYGCNGGFLALAMFASPYGGRLESCYPYTAKKARCKTTCGAAYTISNWAYIVNSSSIPTVDQIKTAIYTYGGVACAVYCDSLMQAYTSGCFSGTAAGSCNHAIELCGWNDTTPCTTGGWYMKNSWGTSWGMSGFMWIKYGSQMIGYAAAYAVYP
ncbi:MAG: C1 family peptidase [Candidatus Omnitrophota bacterium]